jgi:Spy/CpxP family protein refolding chaperone
MKKTILAVATVVALGTSAFAFGGGACQNMGGGMMMGAGMGSGMNGGMMHGNRGMMQGMMFDQLNLTDDQRYKLNVLRSEMRLEMSKLRDPKSMQKMQDLMSGETFDKKAFVKFHNEMHEKMVAIQADHMEKVFNILTKEQRAELKKLMAQRPQRPMMMAPAAPASTTK